MRVFWVFLILSLILATTFSQDSGESEETATPKKVLRKYRVRRPVQGNDNSGDTVTKNSQRVRRVRVKQPRQPIAIEPTPQNLISSRYVNNVQAPTQSPAPVPVQPTQQVFYNEQQLVVDPVRVVPNYRQATPTDTRTALLANVNLRDRDHEDNKKPSIGTTRNYSHINEDGSFTFGYEGEDGSFKEETRGTDCVVRGKYGYVDPGGIRREFSYVSGNPCDPNDPNKGELQDDDDDEDISPARAGVRQRIPVEGGRPIINSNVQQALEQTVEERVPQDQLFRPVLRQRVVRPLPQPQIQQQIQQIAQRQQLDDDQPTTFRPSIRINQSPPQQTVQTATVPSGVIKAFPQFRQPVATVIPRPQIVEPSQDLSDRGSRGFNFQQELQDLSGSIQQLQQPEAAQQHIQYQQQPTAQPQQIQYRQPVATPQPQLPIPYHQPQQHIQHHTSSVHGFPQRQHFGSQATSIFTQQPGIQQHQQIQPLERQPVEAKPEQPVNYARYRTELVYDQATGQYTNVVVQENPKSDEGFTLTQNLRAFADPQRPEQHQFQQYQQPIQYYQQQHQIQPQHHQQQQQLPLGHPLGQQFHYQQQQQPIQYTLQSPQPSAATHSTVTELHPEAQQAANSVATGQIDAFLQTLNLSG